MADFADLLDSTRRAEINILGEAVRFIGSNAMKAEVRQTRHFREWFRCPMNYVRIIELPLTLQLLNPRRTDRILDVSSPKLLALYLARRGFGNTVAADLEEYFVGDFDIYRKYCGTLIDTSVFDAAKIIPFPNDHFDKIFSISVLEHIPNGGDILAVKEMLRVLKPGGSIVITLPAFPVYTEEWIDADTNDVYWSSDRDRSGKVFYQRRYDYEAVSSRMGVAGARQDQLILVAERPLAEPHLDATGKMLHNSYFLDRIRLSRLICNWGHRAKVLPFTAYLAERIASGRCHYLTDDWNDPNIRQVALKIVKDAP
jgi:SAM-dependent methyltransferase